ncbi:hypothetical protein [Micromonospora sp. SL4-19]|uniref:hypothetical protein n=1 Tax=Micromonospora sp. SL4-19 TaxID=3399129 RepID=UPI003A4E2044
MTFIRPDSDHARWAGPGLLGCRPAGLILAAALAAVGLTECSDDGTTAAAPSTPSASPSTSPPSPTPSLTPPADQDGDGIPDSSDTYPYDPKNIPQQEPFVITCYLTDDFDENSPFTILTGNDGRPDFTEVWAAKPVSCSADQEIHPVSPVEEAVRAHDLVEAFLRDWHVALAA